MEPTIRMYPLSLPQKGETITVEGQTYRVEHVIYPKAGWKTAVLAREISTNRLWFFGYSQGCISEPLVYLPGLP